MPPARFSDEAIRRSFNNTFEMQPQEIRTLGRTPKMTIHHQIQV